MEHLKGTWLVLDGIDATGKSTQLQLLGDRLETAGLTVARLPEFSDGLLGDLIRKIIEERRFYSLSPEADTPIADTYALLADFLYKTERQVLPAIQNGHVVLSDRGLLSFYGYQGVRIARGLLSLDSVIKSLSEQLSYAFRFLPGPTLHLHLTVSEEEMQRRVQGRGEEVMQESDLKFMRNVFSTMCGLATSIPTLTLDTTGKTPEEVSEAIWQAIQRNG